MSLTFIIENNVVLSYRRLSYTHWHALAEFVDNSTQAYFNSRDELDPRLKEEGERLEVRITYDRNTASLRIADNSIGMSYEELDRALKIGKPPPNTSGRSQYGMGMKTAACWFGEGWEIVTKRLGENVEHSVFIDVSKVASGNNALEYTTKPKQENAHYTYITVKKLHSKILGRTIWKIKDFLRSIYRVDLREGRLRLWFQDEELVWQDETIFLQKPDGTLYKRDFKFQVYGKDAHGWFGILGKGRTGRANAGFSILRRKRMVRGHPAAWRPEDIYGPGGRNDLINQRLVGEIHLDQFSVSHTKDDIQWENDEEEKVEAALAQECADFTTFIKASGKRQGGDTRGPTAVEVQTATDELRQEMESKEFVDSITIDDAPPPEIVAAANAQIVAKASEHEPDLTLRVGDRQCKIFISDDHSVNDPYYVHEITKESTVVVVNKNHPHWTELQGSEGVFNYLRHCVYDAIAEWKASLRTSPIRPETVRTYKDKLLQLPAEIEDIYSKDANQELE
ncbi:MAG: ATP-binding protein [Rhodospirillales bacterium]|nr:ATP-binding protein [Rhodospirillales bacterium]